MDLHQIGVQLAGLGRPLDGRQISPSGLNGLFYSLIQEYDRETATWLHDHPDPKPFTIAPAHFDRQKRQMAGFLVSTLSEEAADIITAGCRHALEHDIVLRFGEEGSKSAQPCFVSDLIPVETTTFSRLAQGPLSRQASLQFLTPTAFRQRQGELLFPLPANVFRRPFDVWQVFAPEAPDNYHLPVDWLDWCAANVFCTWHEIRTRPANLNRRKKFRGFVGRATFEVRVDRHDERDSELYTRMFNALAHFAGYCGVGRKTAMGMGAVERVGAQS